jgi:uncharacterized protein YcbX
MMKLLLEFIALALVLWSSLTPLPLAIAQAPGQPELIVRFAAGSQGRQATVAAMESGAQAQVHLHEIAQTLSEQIDMPVSVKRVTSGEELIVSVDSEALMAELTKRLQERDDVEYVQPNRLMQPLGGPSQ